MSVQLQQFRVVGVRNGTGEDVSIVIDAATKAAAEVKAEQMDIETTHIVRIKGEEAPAPDEHELFSSEAAEALAGKRTDKLIEEVVPPEEPRESPEPPAPPTPEVKQQTRSKAKPAPEPQAVIAAITRPNYAAPTTTREPVGNVSGMRAFGFVLLVLLAMTAGAYYVLIHEPNNVKAEEHELVFGEDLFSDVINGEMVLGEDPPAVRDAFGASGNSKTAPIGDNKEFIVIGQPQAQAASAGGPPATNHPALQLQSVVTSHEGRFAVINGKFYKQGSTVAGCKLVSVADDWVLMEKDGKQFTLQIEASAD